MYNLMPIIFGTIIILLGIYMITNPVKATKKELREDENAVKKVKRNGYIEIICGIAIIIIGILLKNI